MKPKPELSDINPAVAEALNQVLAKPGAEEHFDQCLQSWCAETEKLIEEHRGHHGPMMSARFSPSGETYASGADDATVRIWQTFPPKPADAE